VIERGELGTPLGDLAELVAQPPTLGPAPQSSQTLPERDANGRGERLSSTGRHFPSQAVGFRILETQRHRFLKSRIIPYI
jgi:hypothetical protein